MRFYPSAAALSLPLFVFPALASGYRFVAFHFLFKNWDGDSSRSLALSRGDPVGIGAEFGLEGVVCLRFLSPFSRRRLFASSSRGRNRAIQKELLCFAISWWPLVRPVPSSAETKARRNCCQICFRPHQI